MKKDMKRYQNTLTYMKIHKNTGTYMKILRFLKFAESLKNILQKCFVIALLKLHL